MIQAQVILDSRSLTGARLTTFKLKFNRTILPEFNTHRAFSRNAASSRAIPVRKILDQVINDPAMPVHWGKNKPGMSASEELTGEDKEKAIKKWLEARDNAVNCAQQLMELGLHKQVANRILEPFAWSHVILTLTEYSNFYNLRLDPEAQPEMLALANAMVKAHKESTPKTLQFGEWHLPLLLDSDKNYNLETQKKISVARCARVSYLNHDGTNPDVVKDLELHDRLLNNGHMSPFEHQATPNNGWWGNFFGWKQYRKFLPNENRTGFDLEAE